MKKNTYIISGLMLALAACGNRQDFVTEQAVDEPICSINKEENGDVRLLRDISRSLEKTPLASKFQSAINHKNFMLCIGEPVDGDVYKYFSGKRLLLVDRNAHAEDIVVDQMWLDFESQILDALQEEDAYLNPEDSLLWNQLIGAHIATAFVTHVDRQFYTGSAEWISLKDHSHYGPIARAYEEAKGNGFNKVDGQLAAFNSAFDIRLADMKTDQEHLTWYASRLKKRRTTEATMCMRMDMNGRMKMDPCVKTVYVKPPANIGKSSLSAQMISELTASLLEEETPYLSVDQAGQYLELGRNNIASNADLHPPLEELNTSLETCCDGAKKGSAFGIGTRGVGLAL